MRHANRKRVLMVSSSIILLCMAVIIGVTYALFTDSREIVHHLKAGTLDVTLMRTNLEYVVLGDDGIMEKIVVDTPYNFTEPTEDSVFGLDSPDIRIVPGSYFEAKLEISNGTEGNVAFDYVARFKLNGDINALAEQLLVTVKDQSDAVVLQKKLSEFSGDGYTLIEGSMKVGDPAESFTVRVEFLDDRDQSEPETGDETSAPMDNDHAAGQEANFDLVVQATQSTTVETEAGTESE